MSLPSELDGDTMPPTEYFEDGCGPCRLMSVQLAYTVADAGPPEKLTLTVDITSMSWRPSALFSIRPAGTTHSPEAAGKSSLKLSPVNGPSGCTAACCRQPAVLGRLPT